MPFSSDKGERVEVGRSFQEGHFLKVILSCHFYLTCRVDAMFGTPAAVLIYEDISRELTWCANIADAWEPKPVPGTAVSLPAGHLHCFYYMIKK